MWDQLGSERYYKELHFNSSAIEVRDKIRYGQLYTAVNLLKIHFFFQH